MSDDRQMKAAITVIFDLQARVRHLEGIAEGLLTQGREHAARLTEFDALVKRNAELTRHVLRLVRQKEELFELVGRFVLERQRTGFDVDPDDVERALREMRGH